MRRCWASGRDRNGIEERCTQDGTRTAAQKPLGYLLRVVATHAALYCEVWLYTFELVRNLKPRMLFFCTVAKRTSKLL